MCPRMHIFWENDRFWAKHPNYFWREQMFWYPHVRKPPRNNFDIVFLVGQGTTCARMVNVWPKMTKNTYFGQNLAFFGQKILIFGSKTFDTYISEKNLGTSFTLFVYQGHILGMSKAYHGHIFDIPWHILGISQAFLGRLLGISWAYIRHITGISWTYLGHIMVTS